MLTDMDYHINALRKALQRLNAGTLAPDAMTRLYDGAGFIAADFHKTVLAQVPAFSLSRNPQLLPNLERHGAELTEELVRLIEGGVVGDFAFVRDFATERAQQRFPLDAALQAYRCGHKLFARWLREMLATPSEAADVALEFADAASTVAANAYVVQTRLMAEVAGDQRAKLLNLLLDGYDEADGRAAELLRSAGYLSARQSYCIVLAQPVDPAEMHNPQRARRLADAVGEVLHGTAARSLVDLRDNRVTVVCSDVSRVSGWTAPQIDLARRLTAKLVLVGPAALIGVSNDAPSTSQIPSAHREAQLALEMASVSRRVVQFSEIPLQQLLLHLAGDDIQRVLPAWSGALLQADRKLRGAVWATLQTYAGQDMNVLKTARHLHVHPNTIYARFEKILEMTGVNARSYRGLSELLLVLDCARR